MVNKFVLVVLIFLGWEALCMIKKLPHTIEIISAFISEWDYILISIWHSLSMIAMGFIIILVLSFLLVLLSQKKIFDDWLNLLITICHPIPGVALLPVIWMTIGPRQEAILIIVIHAMIWPFLINVKQATDEVQRTYRDIISLFDITFYNRIKLFIKGVMPSVISGAKIAWSRGWRAFISAEMIFSVVGESTGIGWYIFEKRIWGPPAGVFAGIIAIIVISLLIEKYVFHYFESITIKKWQ